MSWTICKWFAPRSRQITTPVPHHSVFTGWMPFLPPNQHRQSTEAWGIVCKCDICCQDVSVSHTLVLYWNWWACQQTVIAGLDNPFFLQQTCWWNCSGSPSTEATRARWIAKICGFQLIFCSVLAATHDRERRVSYYRMLLCNCVPMTEWPLKVISAAA